MESLRVVIAEEDVSVSQGIAAALAAEGHQVIGTVSDGDSAVVEALQKHPDVVLVDIRLPGTDGVETIRRITSEHPLPVIALTDGSAPEALEEAAEAGAMAYVHKPGTREDLCAALAISVRRFRDVAALSAEVQNLKDTLETRKFAEQAKGIIMQRLQMTEAEAYAHLREKCRNQQKTMRQAAIEIIEAERQFLEVLSKDPPSKMRARQMEEHT
ncbi:MAG: response regulator [Armatimonadota bacterium]